MSLGALTLAGGLLVESIGINLLQQLHQVGVVLGEMAQSDGRDGDGAR